MLNNKRPHIEPGGTPTLNSSQLLSIHLYEFVQIDFLSSSKKI